MGAASDDRKWHIYTLSDPRDNEVRYVGITTNLSGRHSHHIASARNGSETTHKANWIRKLLSAGVEPIMSVIDSGFGGPWADIEKYWILHYRMRGARLTNATDGGEGTTGRKMTPREIEILSKRMKGKPKSPESVEKRAAKMRGRKLSPEHVEKVRQAGFGRKMSPESIEKTRQAHIGAKRSEDTRRNISVAAKRRFQDPAQIDALRKSNMGRRASDQTRQKQSDVRRGKKSKGRAVIRTEDEFMFSSLQEAANSMGISKSNIRSAIKRSGTCGGYHWQYADNTTRKARNMNFVRCIETDTIYNSVAHAARENGILPSTLNKDIRLGYPCGGYTWEYVDRPTKQSPPDRRSMSGRPTMVIRIEDSVVFPTLNDAAASVGVTCSAVGNAIKRNGTCAGYHWEYVDQD